MRNLGPLGELITLGIAVCGAGVVLWFVGVFWQIGVILGALGWPLVIVALLLAALAGMYVYRSFRPAALARLRPARMPIEQFCDQCGSRLVAGFCPYCDGM